MLMQVRSPRRAAHRMGVAAVRTRSLLLILLALAALLASGCSARAPFTSESAASPADAPAASAPQSATDMSRALAQEGGGAPAGAATSALMARKMVARASLSMVVVDAEATVAEIEALMGEVGGYISQANLYNSGTGDAPVMQGSLQLRVPAEALEPTLDRLETLAVEVGTRTLAREDVTDQYSDLDAQLRNLETTETELREMLDEVNERPNARPEDILTVHNRITEVRGQIEILQGQKNLLDNLIGLSTIDLTMVPDIASLPVVEEGWRPGTVARAATRALVSSLQWVGNAAIWFLIAVLPVLLLLLIPLVVLLALVNWLVRRRRGQKRIAVEASS